MISSLGTRSKFAELGPSGFVRWVYESLGLTRDEFGRPALRDKLSDGSPRMRAEEFSLRCLAESLVGVEGAERLGQVGHPLSMNLLEGANAAVQPSAFQNISAFNATVGGLIEAKVLEQYRRPVFIADRVARTIPTRQRSERLPATSRIGDRAETMQPGQPHPRAQFGERYVTTPETQKRGLAIDITKEAVYFDLTNEMLLRAESIGYELGLRKEKLVLDTVLGLSNSYSYQGSTYNTYLTSGNWVNDHTNPLVDWTDIDAALQLFSAMTDQESGERVVVSPTQLLVMPYKELTAAMVLNSVMLETRTASAAEVRHAANPLAGKYELLCSPIAYQRLTDADGGALDASAAREYWYFGELHRAFGYMENWAMQVVQARAGDYVMADHGLVLSVFADEMGTPVVLEPRYVIRNKN